MAFDLHPSRWVAIFAAFALFFIVFSGNVRYTRGDSRYALLASEALLTHGNLRLDAYNDRFGLWEWNDGHLWMAYRDSASGHTYYDYPVGTPIFAAPFVAVGLAVGYSPINKYDDTQLQMLIACTTLVFIFFLLFRLALLYVDDWGALVFAALFVFGTSIISTLGTALWSQNFETIFIALALLELATVARGKRENLRGAYLGCLLFAAYLCRPTAAPFIVAVFGYLAWRQRKALPWVAGVSGGLLLAFVIWSELEFGRLLPRYYSPETWEPYGDYMHNLWPILFGPARGLFSFMPVLVLLFAGFAFAKLRKEPLFWTLWGWLVLLTIVVLRSKNPWGGWCYGPRFYTEIMPGLAWLLLMTLEASAAWALRWRRVLGTAFLATSLVGVYIHTYQGLYNVTTQDWNGSPNIDQSWNIMRWDWRFPQFLASHRQLDMHNREREMSGLVSETMAKLPKGSVLLFHRPDPEIRDFYAYWNAKDRLHTGIRVYNTVLDLRLAGVQEFWYGTGLYSSLQSHPDIQLDLPEADSVMGPDTVMVHVPTAVGHARFKPSPPK
jgi:hypothetical protein